MATSNLLIATAQDEKRVKRATTRSHTRTRLDQGGKAYHPIG
jgi:hypothetical protein